MKDSEVLDVLIVGAGLSGIDVAYRLQTKCPGKTYAIIEARQRVGGTWDLFRYPGIRSDSDIETLGFPFRSWDKEKSIADGQSIREYIEDTARTYGIDKHIQFGRKVLRAEWSSAQSLWTVYLSDKSIVKSRFLYGCTGYYNYSEAYRPDWAGIEDFKGELIHPQFWPLNFTSTGKKIVVIGSGATAVTLIPSLAQTAATVTMLQRTPTYIAARPSVDPLNKAIRAALPSSVAHKIVRLKNILYGILIFQCARRWPELTKKALKKMIRLELPEANLEKDFTPPYKPWDQRLCLAPDGDFFKTLRSGKATIETDLIERFVPEGILLKSGKILMADAVVTATGLNLQILGGMELFIDSEKLDPGQHFCYKGFFINDVPNFAFALGYTNASWTLKCDLSARYFCRLLRHMDSRGFKVFSPSFGNKHIESEALIELTSGYIQRSRQILPKQGTRKPWRLYQNYFLDWLTLSFSPVDDEWMKFS